ncbi:signal peptidase [Alkalihalobacillus alcalophilus ATCC 27647 = CGMCC 1.3604]|uniref:Signal peptidase I n=1 Tax=Alkalihalobacillus alcalophilus ATCC 27647 = CGMCC 1.3604 TaxID=1218173 RepID=A0A094WSB1_ALKAL|nr:signal peptidase I [Alkalihalobacillus alcalophilus]KGA98948.1 signal peptidase [Alkalihalobacillus alcalophilus ATCC 27647 = CGMCC 1.3604]MED1561983.1 signal peptidase I [Alkalihalobacillus alcalophilus]THG89131.1 signal peptidase [Alkalihalobacillus alcalophilus ATCC 27647 = CGMCC 1.3604]
MKVAMKWSSRLISFVLFVSLVFMVFIVISSKASGGEPELFGYQFKTVLSGSMEPEFQTGSIIAVKPGGDMTRFQEGDIVTFMENENKFITHRVIDVVQSGEHVMYETKGDNNNAPDSALVLSENIIAEYVGFTIPYAGYVGNFAQSKEGAALLLILPGLLLLIYSGFTIWQGISQLEKDNKTKSKLEEVTKVEEMKESV